VNETIPSDATGLPFAFGGKPLRKSRAWESGCAKGIPVKYTPTRKRLRPPAFARDADGMLVTTLPQAADFTMPEMHGPLGYGQRNLTKLLPGFFGNVPRRAVWMPAFIASMETTAFVAAGAAI